MKITTKVSVATMVVLATILLAGCSTTPSVNDTATPSTDGVHPTSSAAADASETKNREEAFIKAVAEGPMAVELVEFIDTHTALIMPDPTVPANAKYAGETTAKLWTSRSIVVPSVGECGYDEALAATKQYFTDNDDLISSPEGLRSAGYWSHILHAGLAYIADSEDGEFDRQQLIKSNKTGLWGTCPGFGV
ncbi:hypothetical protein [Cryobacterium sp. Y29]|jgi:outer membrane murein-binding lipoprotein Lpp|uniref:hypothetical protein n=1 Tax=Cryobacterium sp. Y29 TaxID=2048285 RepID=UPI000CE4BC4B|nr:hypothetical protein [Cryobacterium sp. Y29]